MYDANQQIFAICENNKQQKSDEKIKWRFHEEILIKKMWINFLL